MVGVGRAECLPARQVGDMDERPKVTRCFIEQEFVSQHSQLKLDTLRNTQHALEADNSGIRDDRPISNEPLR